MNEIQTTSSKLQPIIKTNDENTAVTSSHKKEYVIWYASGKENIDSCNKQSETTKVYFGNYRFLSPEKFRTRKASDSVIYQPEQQKHTVAVSSKMKDLIKRWEPKENRNLKRHLSEDCERTGSSNLNIDRETFPKPDFKVYTSKDEIPREGRSGILQAEKLQSRKPNISSIVTLDKKSKVGKQDQIQNKISKLKLQNPVQTLLQTDTTETPVDNLPLPVNLNKIKVYHKKSTLEEKYHEIPSDNLPADVLYNLEYMEDFILLQMELEQSHQLSPEFLKRGTNREQRRMVVSFLIRVTAYCKYPSFILYQTIKMFDAMLDSKQIEIDQLQLVALTSLWITLKRLHTLANIPSAEELLSFSKGEYKESDLFKCEIYIMMTLKCEISFIDPFSILAYYFININNPFLKVNRTDMIYYCASYMIDVSLLSSSFCKTSTFNLITAAAEIALFIVLAKEEDLQNPHWEFWRSCLPKIYHDGRKTMIVEKENDKIRKNLIKLALLTNGSSKEYLAVYKKYKRSRYGCISEVVIGRLMKISQDEINS